MKAKNKVVYVPPVYEERAPVGIYVALVQLFRLDGTVNYFKLPFVLALKI